MTLVCVLIVVMVFLHVTAVVVTVDLMVAVF
jgi:hypothetical protein